MIDEHDTILIQTLTDSFRTQLGYYQSLREVVRQIMSRLVLSRGSLAKITEGLQKKRQLVEYIEVERKRIVAPMSEWQLRKTAIASYDETRTFNQVLETVTDAIRDFLDDEEQLQKYLEGIMSRATHP